MVCRDCRGEASEGVAWTEADLDGESGLGWEVFLCVHVSISGQRVDQPGPVVLWQPPSRS